MTIRRRLSRSWLTITMNLRRLNCSQSRHVRLCAFHRFINLIGSRGWLIRSMLLRWRGGGRYIGTRSKPVDGLRNSFKSGGLDPHPFAYIWLPFADMELMTDSTVRTPPSSSCDGSTSNTMRSRRATVPHSFLKACLCLLIIWTKKSARKQLDRRQYFARFHRRYFKDTNTTAGIHDHMHR